MKISSRFASLVRMSWKTLVCAIGIILFSTTAFAADTHTLYVFLKSGAIDKYILADKPRLTFEADKCVIDCNAVKTEYDMALVEHANFIGPVAINETVAPEVVIDLSTAGHARILGLGDDAFAQVFSMQGLHLLDAAGFDGAIDIDMSDLPSQSFYIISTNKNKSFKIYKK